MRGSIADTCMDAGSRAVCRKPFPSFEIQNFDDFLFYDFLPGFVGYRL